MKKMMTLLAVALACTAASARHKHNAPPPLPRCDACYGSGECHKCEGTGWREGWFTSSICKRCEGTGWCNECGGWGLKRDARPPRRAGYGPKVKHSHRKPEHAAPPPHHKPEHVAPPPKPAPKPVAKPLPKPTPKVRATVVVHPDKPHTPPAKSGTCGTYKKPRK